MIPEPKSLGRADLFQIADGLEAALNVIRRHGGTKTTLDVYVVSVFSTLRRSVLQRALNVEEPAIEGELVN
jgi:hypothetical protein